MISKRRAMNVYAAAGYAEAAFHIMQEVHYVKKYS